jgi:hypothetical protein
LENLLPVFESQNAMLLEVGTPQIVALRDQARAALAQAEQRQGPTAWVGLTEEEEDTSKIGWGMPVEYLLGYRAGMSRAKELLRAKNAAPQSEKMATMRNDTDRINYIDSHGGDGLGLSKNPSGTWWAIPYKKLSAARFPNLREAIDSVMPPKELKQHAPGLYLDSGEFIPAEELNKARYQE